MELILISIIFSVVLIITTVFIIKLINLFEDFIKVAADMHRVMNKQFEQIKKICEELNENKN